MSNLYTPQQIEKILGELNGRFNCDIALEEFQNKSFSTSSLTDLLVQRISDELTGEWTTEKAFSLLKKELVHTGVSSDIIIMDARLNDVFPQSQRRERIKQLSSATGMPIDVLKPNGFLNGLLVFLFFVCIPLGIGVDWFLSGLGMLLCAAGIFVLGKQAKNFKMETLGQMAEDIAWRLYLQQQKSSTNVSQKTIELEVGKALASI